MLQICHQISATLLWLMLMTVVVQWGIWSIHQLILANSCPCPVAHRNQLPMSSTLPRGVQTCVVVLASLVSPLLGIGDSSLLCLPLVAPSLGTILFTLASSLLLLCLCGTHVPNSSSAASVFLVLLSTCHNCRMRSRQIIMLYAGRLRACAETGQAR